MYSFVRGFSRQLLLGLGIINTILFVLGSPTAEWGGWQFLWLSLGSVLLLWLLIDAGVVYYFLRQMSVVKGSRPFVRTFFFDGCSWTHLGARALKTEQFVRWLERRTEPFPELNDEVMKTLRTNGVTAAVALVKHVKLRAPENRREEQQVRNEFGLLFPRESPDPDTNKIPEKEVRALLGELDPR